MTASSAVFPGRRKALPIHSLIDQVATVKRLDFGMPHRKPKRWQL